MHGISSDILEIMIRMSREEGIEGVWVFKRRASESVRRRP